jgi:vesicle-fusing ATPase
LEYAPIGPRFSNLVLQTLLVLIRKVPKACRLLVIATTSIADRLEDLQLTQTFQVNLHVSQLQSATEVSAVLTNLNKNLSAQEVRGLAATVTQPIGIKQLMLVNEMAKSESANDAEREAGRITPGIFMECLNTMGF